MPSSPPFAFLQVAGWLNVLPIYDFKRVECDILYNDSKILSEADIYQLNFSIFIITESFSPDKANIGIQDQYLIQGG